MDQLDIAHENESSEYDDEETKEETHLINGEESSTSNTKRRVQK